MATYYVGPSGADGNSGLTTGAAKRTIAAGIEAARAGDTVEIMAGTYREAVTIDKAITVTNYSSDVVYIDGNNYGLPYTGTYYNAPLTHPLDKERWSSWTGMVTITASNATLSNVIIQYGNGRGIVVQGANPASPITGITISGVTVRYVRNQAIAFISASASTVTGCTFRDIHNYLHLTNGTIRAGTLTYTYNTATYKIGQSRFVNWPASVNVNNGKNAIADMTITDNVFRELYCAGLALNGRGGAMTGSTVTGNTFSEIFREACNIMAEQDYNYSNNVFYWPENGNTNLRASAFYIQPSEQEEIFLVRDNSDGLISNNLIVNMAGAFSFAQDAQSLSALENVVIAHNTAILQGSGGTGITFGTLRGSGNELRNNVFYLYGGAVPASYNKGDRSIVTYSNNYWSTAPATWARGTGDIYASAPGLAAPTADVLRAAPPSPANYKLESDSDLIEAGADMDADVPLDYFGTSRSATTPDIGFHEYSAGEPSLSIDFTPTSATTDTDTAVSFDSTATADNGASVSRYLWDFGDGTSATTADPSKTYTVAGSYSPTVTAWDDTNGLVASKTYANAITVTPVGAAAALDVELVDFAGGDASFSVSATPKLILFYGSGATADDTPAANGEMMLGAWCSAGSFAVGSRTKDASGTTDTNTLKVDSAVVLTITDAAAADVSAAVTGVTASAVSLSWSGSTGARQYTAVCISGAALTGVAIEELALDAAGDLSFETPGNLVIALTSLNSVPTAIANVTQGFALNRSGTVYQACTSWTSRGGVSDGEPYGWVQDEYLWSWARNGARGYVSFSGTAITLVNDAPSLSVGRVGQFIVATLDLTKADAIVGTGALPTTTSAADTALPFDPGTLILGATAPAVGTRLSDSAAAGAMTVYLNDGSSQRSYNIATEQGATPTNENSVTADELLTVNDDGTDFNVGGIVLGTAKFTTTLTTAGGTAVAYSYLALQTPAGDSVPQAAIGVTSDGDAIRALGNVYLRDASDATGGAISAWSWKIDGVEVATTQNYTWVPDAAGTYTVSLTVTNAADSSTDTTSVTVLDPTWSFIGWGSPTSRGPEYGTAATVADSDTYAHPAYGVIDLVVDTLPSAGNVIDLVFRKQDSNNYWRVEVSPDGSLDLIQTAPGDPVDTSRDTAAAGSIEAGDTLSVFLEGPTVTVYVEGVEVASYEGAGNWELAQDGLVNIGTGGACSDLATYQGVIVAEPGDTITAGTSILTGEAATVQRYVYAIKDFVLFGDSGATPESYYNVRYWVLDNEISAAIPVGGSYGVEPGVEYLDSDGETAVAYGEPVPMAITEAIDATFVDEHGGGTQTGSYTARFVAKQYPGALYTWTPEPGETDTTSGSIAEYTYTDAGTYSPSLTIGAFYGAVDSDTYTWTDGITIAAVPTAPLTQEQLNDLLVDMKTHFGILDGVTWVQQGAPNTSVWAVALTGHEWADGMTVRVLENNTLLTAQASVAAAQAAAGSSFYEFSSGTLTVYVHPTTGDNPNLNGKNYRWID